MKYLIKRLLYFPKYLIRKTIYFGINTILKLFKL